VIPGRVPRLSDVDRFVESLVQLGSTRFIVNLYDLDSLTGSLVGALVALNKKARSAKSSLILCGLRPIVREIFERFRLEKAFDIAEGEKEAIRDLGRQGSPNVWGTTKGATESGSILR